jgi:hypothetical protein
MSDSEELNQIYLDARKELNNARFVLQPNSDEDLEVGRAIDELDLANLNRINAEYGEGTNKLNALVAKLEEVKAKIEANPVSTSVEKIDGALGKVNSLASKLAQLKSSGDNG